MLGNKDRINEYKYMDIKELVNGIKPKLPKSPYHIFLREKSILNEIHSIYEGRLKWKKLNDNEKSRYYLIFNRKKLAYEYKKIIYKKKINQFIPKRPGGPLQFYIKDKKGIKPPSNDNIIIYWSNKYNLLNNEEKKIYIKKSQIAFKEYKKNLINFRNMVFIRPKKPLNSFLIYFSERSKQITDKNIKLNESQILKKISKEWKEDKNINKKKYLKLAEIDKFNELGYYLKNDDYYQKKNFNKNLITNGYIYIKNRPKLIDKRNFNIKKYINKISKIFNTKK